MALAGLAGGIWGVPLPLGKGVAVPVPKGERVPVGAPNGERVPVGSGGGGAARSTVSFSR